MAVQPVGPEIQSQEINDNFSDVENNIESHKAESASNKVFAKSIVNDSTTSTTFSDTSLQASIIPKHADSKILVMVSGYAIADRVAGTAFGSRSGFFRVTANGVVVAGTMFGYIGDSTLEGRPFRTPITLIGWIDAIDTNIKTFKLQFASELQDNLRVRLIGTDYPATMVLMEVRP